MILNQSKTDRAEVGIRKWANNKGIGTLNWTMQFGKTRAGCLIAARVTIPSHRPVLVVVPSQVIKDNWILSIKEFTNLALDDQIFVLTIMEVTNSIANNTMFSPILMILDEIHKYTSEVAATIFTTVKYSYILGLTGTYPTGKDRLLLDTYCPVVDIITEQEALKNGWISNFKEYNVLLDLPNEDKIRYERFSKPIKEILNLFKGSYILFFNKRTNKYMFDSDYSVIQACATGVSVKDDLGKVIYFGADKIRETLAYLKGWNTQLDLSNELSAQIDSNWSPGVIEINAKSFVEAVRRRNEILINHPAKLEAVIEIYRKNPVPTICFNESTDFADLISDEINRQFAETTNIAITYHSNVKSKTIKDPRTGDVILNKKGEPKVFGKTSLKNMAILGMQNGDITFLSTAKALDEGISLPILRQVITTAGTTNPIQYKQRAARGKTVDIYDVNKVTNIFNLCFNDFIGIDDKLVRSRDLQKLMLRQQDNKIIPIFIEGIDELKNYDLE